MLPIGLAVESNQLVGIFNSNRPQVNLAISISFWLPFLHLNRSITQNRWQILATLEAKHRVRLPRCTNPCRALALKSWIDSNSNYVYIMSTYNIYISSGMTVRSSKPEVAWCLIWRGKACIFWWGRQDHPRSRPFGSGRSVHSIGPEH